MNASIKRRQVLRGLFGVTLALPFLESLDSSPVRAAPTTNPKRFVAFFQGCGVDISRFWPTALGAITGATLTGTALEPLAPYASKLLIPRGIQGSPRGYNFDKAQNGANDHNLGTSSRLTAAALDAVADQHYATGISVDQEMAKSINPPDRSALTLGVGRHMNGSADGYISYLGSGNPAPRQENPWLVFQAFMGGDPGSMVDLVLLRRQSVLDTVKRDFDRITASPKLSKADREKLDLHASSIRDLEQGMVSSGAIACALPPATVTELQAIDPAKVENDDQFQTIGKLQMDVLALALACGHTNAATLMWGSGEGGPVFSWLGHKNEHHLISHRVVDYASTTPLANAIDMLHQIDQWYASQLKYLLDKLSAYTEADGSTVLDNSAVVWLNELSNGSIHHFADQPIVIAGGAGGYLKRGEYIKVTKNPLATGPDDVTPGDDAPHNKLLTTLLNAVGATQNGAPYTNFGQFGAAGEYTELKA